MAVAVVTEYGCDREIEALGRAGVRGVAVSLRGVEMDTGLAVPWKLPGFLAGEVPDGILVRSTPAEPSLQQWGWDVLCGLQDYGVLVWNAPHAAALSRNKARASAALTSRRVPTPRAWCSSGVVPDEYGSPRVVKPVVGSNGEGVEIWDGIQGVGGVGCWTTDIVYRQAWVDTGGSVEEGWVDYRVLVSGGKALAQMLRRSRIGWVVGLSSGASAERSGRSDVNDLAVRAVKALGLNYGGVDIAEGANGLEVIEVNACPQWNAGQQSTSSVNLAAAVVADFLDSIRLR
jgi:ribosomal protein S6--L-glutamate ligase